MQKYTKAILALAGVLLPFLEQVGVPLPAFLTLDWLQGLVLALTPVAVYWFPNIDQYGTNLSSVRSPTVVGILAGLLALVMLAGCSGTRQAYKAADGLEETAYVLSEHFYALVREGNRLKTSGALSGSNLTRAQQIVGEASPIVVNLGNVARNYSAVRSASNETELQAAINAAAVAISRLVDALKLSGSTSSVIQEVERDLFDVRVASLGHALASSRP